jgi:hypothetical protein
MRRRGLLLISVPAVLTTATVCALAQPEPIDAQAKALALITDAADRLCSIVKQAGSSQSLKVQGDVKAQLNGLIRQLVDAGISGAADFNADQYEGVIHADLAAAIEHNADCKLKVFDTLQAKMIK